MPPGRAIRRALLALVAVVVVAVFLPPLISLNRFHAGIARGISGALGRPVSVSHVSLRLFPQPGLDLAGFVVQDDAAFSAEPLLRAGQVTATLRLSSLWRGRLEIGSLTLKEPSLNLVRAGDGRWNVQALLTRAAQTPSAPTSKTRPEIRPRFPYIEAEGGRINFKSGQEKKVYALSEADFALWLASENEWGMRLRARPMRTDSNLSDTGVLEVAGTFGRVAELSETPVNLRASLVGAQLGQLTRLIYGRDRGWRGGASLAVRVAGTPRDLKVSAEAAVDDFQRYDIISRDTLRLSGRCAAQFQWQSGTLSQMECHSSPTSGDVALRGSIAGLPGTPSYDLSLDAQNVPMSEMARFARHAKLDLPEDLTATGSLDANFTYRSQPGRAGGPWEGNGNITDFTLRSSSLGTELPLGSVRFAISRVPTAVGGSRRAAVSRSAASGTEQRLVVAAFSLPLGGDKPATVRGSFSRADYQVGISGDAEFERLLQVARSLGIHAPRLRGNGEARLDLTIAGAWSGFTAAVATGTMQLRNLTLHFAGVDSPVHVRAASAILSPDAVMLQNLTASLPAAHLVIDGSLALPRNCRAPQSCPVHFELHAPEVALEELNRLLNPQMRKVPWYKLLTAESGSALADLHAEGRMTVDRVLVRPVAVSHVSLQAQLADGQLVLSGVRGDLLGGRVRGEWRADFSGNVPAYSGSGKFEHVSLAQISSLMRDDWATGSLTGGFRVSLAGWNSGELAQSAEGSMDFDWQDGMLRHVSLDGGTGLRLKRFAGRAVLREARLEFAQSRLEAADRIYQVSGTVSLGRRLDLRLAGSNARSYAVSGSLEKPRITVIAESATQAALGK